MTHGTLGIPTLVTLVRDDRILGLTLETGFDGLTLLADHMMTLTLLTVKLAMTEGAIVRRAGATHIIGTIKSTTRFAAFPLTTVMGSVVGVEPSFTVQAIVRAVHERRKRRTTIKMMIRFE